MKLDKILLGVMLALSGCKVPFPREHKTIIYHYLDQDRNGLYELLYEIRIHKNKVYLSIDKIKEIIPSGKNTYQMVDDLFLLNQHTQNSSKRHVDSEWRKIIIFTSDSTKTYFF